MTCELDNTMERHDQLYRLAYREYLNDDLIAAQKMAKEAFEIAVSFRRNHGGLAEPQRFSCRAKTLLDAIEWRSLLVQEK